MKMIREEVETIVGFKKSTASPIFVSYSKGRFKILKVLKSWKERRNLKECLIYLCLIEEKNNPVELRWEIESNRWFLEKI